MVKVLFHSFFILTASVSLGQVKVKKINELPKSLKETSGLIWYQNKYFISHNDGGNKSELFVLNEDGELHKKVNVKDTDNTDWEDLAKDNLGRLYIGDFGNNSNTRKKCQIYILPRGFLQKKKVKPKKIVFTYEDQEQYPPKRKNMNYDCEAFFWKDGYLYLLTKCRTKPFTGESRIYRVPSKRGEHEAKYMGSIQLCTGGWRFCSVTGADYDPISRTLVILTYSRMYTLKHAENEPFWKGKLKSHSLPAIKQREAICIQSEGKYYMTDEVKKGLGGGNLYRIKLKKK